ncbi:MAG: hemolysin family protein [Verrucomicrobiae bacterium]|nr:hemolysin family protein [Verrucomicrobiae bacterium]
MHFLTECLIIGCMLAVNAVFASYEMALAALSMSRIEACRQAGRKGARSALYMKERMEGSLAVVQLGITLAGAVAAATGGVSVDEYLSPFLAGSFHISQDAADFLALALFVIPLSVVTIIFAELTPKMFAIHNKEWVALTLSPVMRWVFRFFYPVVFFLEFAVKWIVQAGSRRWPRKDASPQLDLLELRAATTLARTSRMIGPLEERIVMSAVQLTTRTVREIMLHPKDIIMIGEESSLPDALVQAHLHFHTRYPVCRVKDDPQTIVGFVNFKDIVAVLNFAPDEPSLKKIIRPMVRFSWKLPLAKALASMIQNHAHIALAMDEENRVVGMITLEDVFEELIGDIEDEHDQLPVRIQALPQCWIVAGGASLESIRAALGVPAFFTDERNGLSLAEYAGNFLDKPGIACGDVFRLGFMEVQVRKMRRGRILEAVARRCQNPV